MPDGQNTGGSSAIQIALFLLSESAAGTSVDEVVLSNLQGEIVAAGEPVTVLASAPKPLECSAIEREGRIIVTCRPLQASFARELFRAEGQDCEGGVGKLVRERSGIGESGRVLLLGKQDSLLVGAKHFLEFESEFLIMTPYFAVDVRKPGEWERRRDIVAVVLLDRISPPEPGNENFHTDNVARIITEEALVESLRLSGYEIRKIHAF
jgi:hypothetical protein